MAVIDATDLILGRMVSKVAKRALLGEKIDIVNCEKAIITGNKQQILAKARHRRELGGPQSGPFFPRPPDKYVRRVLRGMLSYKQKRGKDAYQRVKCHIGVPKGLENKKFETMDFASINKLSTIKYITVETVCKLMGAKI